MDTAQLSFKQTEKFRPAVASDCYEVWEGPRFIGHVIRFTGKQWRARLNGYPGPVRTTRAKAVEDLVSWEKHKIAPANPVVVAK